MPLIKPVRQDEATEEAKELLAEIEQHYAGGQVPLPWRVMAHNPEFLKKTWEQAKSIRRPSDKLDAKNKEIVAFVVAMTNDCRYCLSSHGQILRDQYGFSDEDIVELAGLVAYWSLMNRFNNGLML